ncbi:MAG: hypothetical protein QW568_03905 [Candidatus Anstonellaceae archaeon]
MFMRKALLALTAIFLIILAYVALYQKPAPKYGDEHSHADFKVYINGEAINFSQEKYLSGNVSGKRRDLSPFTHLHDTDGNVVHKHMSGITVGTFLSSLNMRFNSTCFSLDNGTSYCNSGNATVRMFVQHSGGNWQQNYEYEKYSFSDLDRFLITYGAASPAELQSQMESVTDRACIPSGKCPERGLPQDESSCDTDSGECD